MNVIDKETAIRICKESTSIADFCRKVGWQPRGDNYKIFYKYKKEYNLDTKHFTGKRSNLGNKNNIGLSKEDFFKKDKLIRGKDVIKKLIDLHLKEYKCEICGISEWNGKPIVLQLHHKDGDHFNNELTNLELICPNCHSQTDTFAGRKNKKCTRIYKPEYKHKCKCCGKRLRKQTKSGLCRECLKNSKHKIKSAQVETFDVEHP